MQIMVFFLLCIGALSIGGIAFILTYKPSVFEVKDAAKKLYSGRERAEVMQKTIAERSQKKDRIKDFIHVSDKFKQQFDSSGMSMSANEFALIWGLAIFIPLLLALLITKSPIVAFGVAVIGGIIPYLLFKRKRKKTTAKFTKQLGSALDTITNALRSGSTFQSAMRSIVKDMPDPISSEFKKAVSEMDYGIPQDVALTHMYERTQNEDLKLLVTSLRLVQKTGGSLTDVLATISNTIHSRIQIKQKIDSLSAQGRMSSILIGALPVGVFLFIMITNPNYVKPLISTTTGRLLLIVAAIMELLGFKIIQKITNITL